MTELLTVGHGTRLLPELVAVLQAAGVTCLVDVRRHPGSRRNPQHARATLARELPAAGIAYEWCGDALGGRRTARAGSPNGAWRDPSFRAYADHMASPEFLHALDALLALASRQPTAVMCAETLWWRCHRRLIADAATVRGFAVVHLGAGKPQPHRLHPSVRVDAEGNLVYDVGVDRPLDG